MKPLAPYPDPHPKGFFRWEDLGTDFPFYREEPATVSNGQWCIVVSVVAIAFLALALSASLPVKGLFWAFIPAVGLAALPLIALALVAPRHWGCLFGRVGSREVRLMLGFALLNIVISMTVGAAVMAMFGTASNASTAQLGALDTAGQIAFFAKTLPQLLGEEVITILPFLAILQWLTIGLGRSRKTAVMCAWVLTSVLFGMLHLPTYDWNWVQCIFVIGGARMVLTLPWIMTKNLWVSTGAHITNDWLLFGVGLLGAGLASKV
ncbi:MAG: CPBP family intramembrane metalloprotease [Burkholderiales bacterium PBB4]|nr:MAG: CPBP family intramembrane metalloprotease [Burkholderiales bacterium PBB4]